MTSRKNLSVALTIVLGIFAIKTHARSWNLAVVIGREVKFYAHNSTVIGQALVKEAGSLSAVAYDDTTHMMYFSDLNNKNVSIFRNDLQDKNFTLKPLLKKQEESNIVGLAFDTRTRTLFWSDTQQAVIMKMRLPNDGPPEKPTLVHNLTDQIPRAIALDVCNSRIYWVNSNFTSPSIEMSNLDGSNRTIVIKDGLFEPMAIAIDHAEGKLYWIDDIEGIRIKVQRSNLDGTNQEPLVHPKRHQPGYLAIDQDLIYWSDTVHNAVWTFPKNATHEDMLNTFELYSNKPAGVVARDNIGTIDCAAIAKRQKMRLKESSTLTQIGSYSNLTTSTEESEFAETPKHCLNDGYVEDKNGVPVCQCKLGFNGTFCEMHLCHNYCFQGSCNIDDEGLPMCKCSGTFVGLRCETDLCKDYCLHDGQCSVLNQRPVCKCKYSMGSRCETLSNITELCQKYCANTEPIPSSIDTANCRCSEQSERVVEIRTHQDNDIYGTLLPIVGVLIILLLLVIIVLSFYVNKLRRQPRIKRINPGKRVETALTSRPQLRDSRCEIIIDNCCNMNICETPCFETKLRAAPSEANGKKKEEKNSLLDNMEEITW
ncbi:low-density lipoprotein receptor repeat domain-containing protein cueball [Xylocopa sonorina]|uniref:low-density lipoprotein receptor repeat domain-containing protein cueball n=1 Tax=Xylocopa sonorina TaxID=1818115 RepID=UPI00403AFE34